MQQQNQRVLLFNPQPETGDPPLPLDPTTALWLRQAPTAAFDALLDRADPQAAVPVSAEARANRRLCGRWLAVQRLRLGIPSGDDVAECAGVDEVTLRLLEFGLATETQVPELIIERLSCLFADAEHDQGWVRDLLSIAVGRSHAHEAQMLQRAAADLSAPRIDPATSNEQDDGYELFRRAIEGRDDDAWIEIHTRYQTLLVAWVRRCSASAHCEESPADLADRALARAWAALAPARFADFPNLAALLAYLRACVSTVVIDSARAQAGRERIQSVSQSAVIDSSDQIVLAALDNAALWCTVGALTTSAAERVTLIESCIYNLSPRAILARHPKLFVDVAAVYTAKRNLFARLQRSPELLQLHREWHSSLIR